MPIISVPTFTQQIQTVRQRILANRKDISTLPGSVTGDIFVVPQALSDVQQFAIIYYDSASHSVSDLLALKVNASILALLATALSVTVNDILVDISNQLDKLGDNVGVPRLQPKKASGGLTLGRVDLPTANITVPAGTVAKSSSGQTYTSTSPVTMYVANAANYYNAELQQFVIPVPAEATLAGSNGNTAARTVVSLVTPVAGLPLVTNLDIFDGGTNLETDEAYGARILDKWQAIGAVTKAGVVGNAATIGNVTGSYLATPGNPLATRGVGKADLFIKDVVAMQVTETFSGYNSPLFSDGIRPSTQPVIGVVSADSGTPFLQRDQASALAHSVRAQDAIRFSVAPTFPVTITYLVNKRVQDVQNIYATGEYSPLNYQEPSTDLAAVQTPLLVKEAPVLSVDYTASITVLPGYSQAGVVAAVQANLATYSSGLVLGQKVYLTDLNAIVEATAGVLRLTGTPTKFAPTDSSGVYTVIVPAANQYIELTNINIF